MENNLAKHNTSVYQQLPKKSPQSQLEGWELRSKAGYDQMEPNVTQQKWKLIGHTSRKSSNSYHQTVTSGPGADPGRFVGFRTSDEPPSETKKFF